MLAISWSIGDIIPLLSPEFFSVNFFYDFRLKCIFLRLMANFLVFDSFNGYRLTSLRLCQCNSKIFLTNTYGDVQQLTGRKITDQILGDFGVLISIQERTWTFVDSNDFSKWIFLFFFITFLLNSLTPRSDWHLISP